MKWMLIKHKELQEKTEVLISELKDQSWPHGIDSQREWMKKNVREEDIHLLGIVERKNREEIKAYLTISRVDICMDGEERQCLGIGCVCVDKTLRHKGIGSSLIEEANNYIIQSKKRGILLCKKELVPFYKQLGWDLLNYRKAFIDKSIYEKEIMMMKETVSCNKICINRMF